MIETRILQNLFPEAYLDTVNSFYVRSGLTYGWNSSRDNPQDQGHWNRQILKKSRWFPYDQAKLPDYKNHKVIQVMWDKLQEVIGKRTLVRCYINGYTTGTDGYSHRDDTWIKANYGIHTETIIVYLNKEWNIDWAGETVIFDDDREIEASVLPKFNRTLVFDSDKLHAARPVSRICPTLRAVLVFKTATEVINDERIDFLFKNTSDVRHGQRTFFEHLYGTEQVLEQMGCTSEVCAAGLFHAINGTQRFKHSLNVSQEKLRSLIGVYPEKLVRIFGETQNKEQSFIYNTGGWDNQTQKDLLSIAYANLVDSDNSGQFSELILSLDDKLKELKNG